MSEDFSAFTNDYKDLLDEYGARHGDVIRADAEYFSIMDRVSDIDNGPEKEARSDERRRALDKAKIMREKVEQARAARDATHMKIEELRFRAQIELDITLAPLSLPGRY